MMMMKNSRNVEGALLVCDILWYMVKSFKHKYSSVCITS